MSYPNSNQSSCNNFQTSGVTPPLGRPPFSPRIIHGSPGNPNVPAPSPVTFGLNGNPNTPAPNNFPCHPFLQYPFNSRQVPSLPSPPPVADALPPFLPPILPPIPKAPVQETQNSTEYEVAVTHTGQSFLTLETDEETPTVGTKKRSRTQARRSSPETDHRIRKSGKTYKSVSGRTKKHNKRSRKSLSGSETPSLSDHESEIDNRALKKDVQVISKLISTTPKNSGHHGKVMKKNKESSHTSSETDSDSNGSSGESASSRDLLIKKLQDQVKNLGNKRKRTASKHTKVSGKTTEKSLKTGSSKKKSEKTKHSKHGIDVSDLDTGSAASSGTKPNDAYSSTDDGGEKVERPSKHRLPKKFKPTKTNYDDNKVGGFKLPRKIRDSETTRRLGVAGVDPYDLRVVDYIWKGPESWDVRYLASGNYAQMRVFRSFEDAQFAAAFCRATRDDGTGKLKLRNLITHLAKTEGIELRSFKDRMKLMSRIVDAAIQGVLATYGPGGSSEVSAMNEKVTQLISIVDRLKTENDGLQGELGRRPGMNGTPQTFIPSVFRIPTAPSENTTSPVGLTPNMSFTPPIPHINSPVNSQQLTIPFTAPHQLIHQQSTTPISSSSSSAPMQGMDTQVIIDSSGIPRTYGIMRGTGDSVREPILLDREPHKAQHTPVPISAISAPNNALTPAQQKTINEILAASQKNTDSTQEIASGSGTNEPPAKRSHCFSGGVFSQNFEHLFSNNQGYRMLLREHNIDKLTEERVRHLWQAEALSKEVRGKIKERALQLLGHLTDAGIANIEKETRKNSIQTWASTWGLPMSIMQKCKAIEPLCTLLTTCAHIMRPEEEGWNYL